ncbi:MAG: ATP-dependent Clp protease adaptor ClpS [Ignavibacteria bacterium]|nr:ATP-dependent Clp protease adaptor ClpS [Ignavibacteria bacterium]
MTKEKLQDDLLLDDKISDKKQIVVYNDDVNTFDWVIQSLIEVCKHQPEQATQCAYIVHFNGKCDVKNGSFEELKPLCLELLNRKISAKIE